jgi:hypothetical protein
MLKKFNQYVKENYKSELANQLGVDAGEFEDSSDLGDLVGRFDDENSDYEFDKEEAEALYDEFVEAYPEMISSYLNSEIPGMVRTREEKVKSLVKRIMNFFKKNYDISVVNSLKNFEMALTDIVKNKIK